MRARTEAEIRAYVDGYNACYKQFCEELSIHRPLAESIEKMKMFWVVVNNCVEVDEQTDCPWK